MLIRLLCVYRMTKYVGKILLWNSKRLLRKLQKILGGYFFATPCIYLNIKSNPHSNTSINSVFLYQIFLCRRTESAQTRKHDTGRRKPSSNRYNSASRSGLVVARLPAVREVPGTNRAADKKSVFFAKITAIRSFGHGLHTDCSV